MSYKPWKEAHKLFRAQCGTDEDMDPMVSRVAEMSIYVANGMLIWYLINCQNE